MSIKVQIVVFCLSALILGLGTRMSGPYDEARKKFSIDLKQFGTSANHLFENAKTAQTRQALQAPFLELRLLYKKLQIVVEFQSPYAAMLLNAPPVQAGELKQAPQGLQVLEELIYDEDAFDPEGRKEILAEIRNILNGVAFLERQQSRFQFDKYLLEALQDELYRVMTLGLSGFDVPLCKNAIPEARVSFETMLAYHDIFSGALPEKEARLFKKARTYLEGAIRKCDAQQDFDQFNRLGLIRDDLNPLGRLYARVRNRLQLNTGPREEYLFAGPLVDKSKYLLDEGFFSTRFFSKDSADNRDKIALGRRLFFDPILSSDSSRSCASCHKPDQFFTDGLKKSIAFDGHSEVKRNAPTLWNSSLQRDLFYDHRQKFMEDLVKEVIGNTFEMNSSVYVVAAKIQRSASYKEPFVKTYRTDKPEADQIANAIAAYVRSLVTFNTRFDQHVRGSKKSLNEQEIRGFNLFMSKAKCGTCHFMPLFNGSRPPGYYVIESEVIGVPVDTNTLETSIDPDKGRIHTSGAVVHEFAFKTPTLRNIARTAPYMHNGVYMTLEEVVDFYNKGGGAGLGIDLPHQTLPFDKLNLTDSEKNDLIAFLKTLDDQKFPSH